MSNIYTWIFFSLITYILLRAYIFFGHKLGFYEKKNDYIIKKKLVIKSGGIVFGIAIFFYFLYKGLINPQNYNDFYRSAFIIPFLVIISAIIFFIDDLIDLSKRLRFLYQIILCFFGLSVINLPILEFLPFKIEIFIFVFFWTYILNVNNFLDGLDGYLITNFLFFLLQVLILLNLKNSILYNLLLDDVIVIIFILIPFLIFNFPNAKIYMGDSGSIVVGFLVGLIFLKLYEAGYKLELLFMYSFFMIDVSFTLAHRILVQKIAPWSRLFDYISFEPVINFKKKHSSILKISIFFNIIITLIFFLYLKVNNELLIILHFLIIFFQFIFFRNKKFWENLN